MRASWAEGALEDDGFTLIELLIVILIVGLLAAIALPRFLNQREKAHDAAAKSDLRNLANFEEIYLNDYGIYTDATTLVASEPQVVSSKGVLLSVVRYDADSGYCLSAQYQGPDAILWFYDSEAGGVQPEGSTDCPFVHAGVGTPGNSLPVS